MGRVVGGPGSAWRLAKCSLRESSLSRGGVLFRHGTLTGLLGIEGVIEGRVGPECSALQKRVCGGHVPEEAAVILTCGIQRRYGVHIARGGASAAAQKASMAAW